MPAIHDHEIEPAFLDRFDTRLSNRGCVDAVALVQSKIFVASRTNYRPCSALSQPFVAVIHTH